MPSYSKDLIINAPKEMILRLMTDPFLVTGIFGHVGLLRVYDVKQGSYVDFNKLSGFSNKFLVVYIFGTPEEKIELYKGEMEGPIFESGSILYRGWTMERKFTWEARFEASYIKPNQTLVRAVASCEYKLSTLEKILGKTPFTLAQHLIEDHIVPYINYYLKTKGEAEIEEVTPVKLLDEQGLFSQVLPKITETIKDVEYGVVIIKGERLSGKMIVKNGTISGIEVNDNGKIMQGENAMLYLVSLPQQVRVSIYTVNLDELISVNISRDVMQSGPNVNLNQKL
jgi:hypothetical protein